CSEEVPENGNLGGCGGGLFGTEVPANSDSIPIGSIRAGTSGASRTNLRGGNPEKRGDATQSACSPGAKSSLNRPSRKAPEAPVSQLTGGSSSAFWQGPASHQAPRRGACSPRRCSSGFTGALP